ncbi:metallophosphoesterase, partial [Leptotrichia trevisanii]|uniref:metallophosphoesterase n=1 Tax=Leptotrichia trevisanii TaxID=109328 RepID=UPI0026EF39E9
MKTKSWIIKFLLVFVVLIVIFLIDAHYEYRHIKIKTIEIKSKDIPKEFDGKRVLFVADFQYDTMTRFNRVQEKKAIELINAQKKDMILLGGDYATWEKNIPKFYEDAKDIKIPELGVYAIYGNHEYPGAEKTAENMKKLGFNLLVNEN